MASVKLLIDSQIRISAESFATRPDPTMDVLLTFLTEPTSARATCTTPPPWHMRKRLDVRRMCCCSWNSCCVSCAMLRSFSSRSEVESGGGGGQSSN